MVEEHLDVSGVISLTEVSLRNPGTLSVHIVVGQICCVPDDVFMIILIKDWTATRQDRCERGHEDGVPQTHLFLGMLFTDG